MFSLLILAVSFVVFLIAFPKGGTKDPLTHAIKSKSTTFSGVYDTALLYTDSTSTSVVVFVNKEEVVGSLHLEGVFKRLDNLGNDLIVEGNRNIILKFDLLDEGVKYVSNSFTDSEVTAASLLYYSGDKRADYPSVDNTGIEKQVEGVPYSFSFESTSRKNITVDDYLLFDFIK